MKILVADDRSDDRWLAVRELRKTFPHAAFVEIDSIDSFNAALRAPFDLIVSDYSMGWMDGLAVLRAVKAELPDTPVIMLTGMGGEDVAVEAMHQGVDDYLLKRHIERLGFAARRSLERAAARTEARLAWQRFSDLFRSVPVGLGLCRPDGELIDANESLLAILGLDSTLLTKTVRLTDFFGIDHHGAWDAARSGDAPEICLQPADRAAAWAVLRVREMEVHGDTQFECALTDVTDLKQAQRERGALLGELYHRVNNNLQLLTAFVVSLSNQTADPVIRQGLDDLTNRIQSIALVQSRLYKSDDFEHVNLRDFLDELLQSLLQGTSVTLGTDLNDVVVPVSRAIPVGLIANELLMNALKHAFHDIAEPVLTVSLRPSDDGGLLTVEDNGVGVEPTGRDGYGTKLIRSLTRQADATLESRSQPGAGTRVSLTFPIT